MSEVTIQNTPLTMFGKYRNQECTEEMILNDQNYFRFLISHPEYFKYKTQLERLIKNVLDTTEYYLDFGKYKDQQKTLTWLINNDSKYYNWAKDNIDNKVFKYEVQKLESEANIRF